MKLKQLGKKAIVTAALALSLAVTGTVGAVPLGTIVTAQAAAELTWTSDTIAINETLNLKNSLYGTSKKATYTYSSNKKSVATVSKKGVITGKAKGTAKITVKEKKNGKTKKVGTFTVTVKQAEIADWAYNSYGFTTIAGYMEANPYQMDASYCVYYYNKKATYTWTSGNPTALTISKDGKVTHAEGTGDTAVKLTLKETYKGKTRTVGSFEVTVSEPRVIDTEKSLEVGDAIGVADPVSVGLAYSWYAMTSESLYATEAEVRAALADSTEADGEGSDDVLNWRDWGDWYLEAGKAGTAYIYYFSYDQSIYYGYTKVTVTERTDDDDYWDY